MGELVTQKHKITLQAFDDTVQSAFRAASGISALREFFAKTRALLGAQNINLVVYTRAERRSAFGLHDRDAVDLVPEMMNRNDIPWMTFPQQATSRSQAMCMASFQCSPVYSCYYRPYGLLHGARRCLTLPEMSGGLVVDRSITESDFGAEELEVIDRLAMHLERVFAWHDNHARGIPDRWWTRPEGACNQDHEAPGIQQRAIGFGLTPAELRLIIPLSKGTGLKRAACELGISPNTAKSRLRSIFEKTGTHRQAELVSLLFTPVPREDGVNF